MTGFAFPEMLVEVCRKWFAGDKEGAEDLYDAYLPVVRHEQQPGIGLALRKETLRRKIGAGAAILFKGSGFYLTDYRSDSYKKAAKADKEAGSGSSGSNGSASKPESKPAPSSPSSD